MWKEQVGPRLAHWRSILTGLTWRALFGVPFAVLSLLALIRDEFASSEWRERLRMPSLLPDFTWQTWLIFALIVLLFVILESSYREHAAEMRIADDLKHRLEELDLAAAPVLAFAPSLSPAERFPRPLDDARLHRIAIQNTSETRALHNVEVTISFIPSDGSSRTAPRPVKDSDGQSAWDLNPGGAKQIDLLATKPDKRPPRVYFAPYGLNLSPRSANDGSCDVFLEATCRETRKVQGQFRLTLTGDGQLRWQAVG